MLLWPSYSVAIIVPGVVKKNKIFKKSTKITRERKKKKKLSGTEVVLWVRKVAKEELSLKIAAPLSSLKQGLCFVSLFLLRAFSWPCRS